MAIRMLRFFNDAILRKTSKPVKEITPGVLTLLDDMLETMRSKEGLGLAAPQVGILKRVVIIDVNDGEGLLELINPEIMEAEGIQRNNEGCLSVPGKKGQVERPKFVKVKALNRHGEEIIVSGEDMKAVAFCHEIDHLNGILYTDKVSKLVDDDSDDETEPD